MRSFAAVVAVALVTGVAWAEDWEPAGLEGVQVTGFETDLVGAGLYASTLGGGVYVTQDTTSTWIPWNEGLGDDSVRTLSSIAPFGESRCPYVLLYAGTASGVWYRWTEDPDMGDSVWQPASEGLSELDITAIGTDGMWMAVCGTGDGSVYRRCLDDSSWQGITSTVFGSGPIVSVAVAWWGDIYVVSHGGQGDCLYRSCDGGESWEPLVLGEQARVVAAEGWPGAVWAGCSAGLVAVSSDSGASWVLSQPFPPASTCTCLLQWYGEEGWAGADSGEVCRTGDGGATWWSEGDGLEAILSLKRLGRTLLAGTTAGVYRLEEASAEEPCPGRLFSLRLWPNPSADRPKVGLFLPAEARVSFGVYDILGRRVAAICGRLSAGSHVFTCPGGNALVPGVYTCAADAGGRKTTRRFVITGP